MYDLFHLNPIDSNPYKLIPLNPTDSKYKIYSRIANEIITNNDTNVEYIYHSDVYRS